MRPWGRAMALTKHKAGCFIDALELALGAPANVIAERYQLLVPDHDPDVDGYHPSITNMILLEKFGIGTTEIDLRPINDAGEEVNPDVTNVVASWFKRPGFKCVAVGLNSNNEPHANAFCRGRWIDTIGPTHLDEPSIQLLSLFVMDLPLVEAEQKGVDDADKAESV